MYTNVSFAELQTAIAAGASQGIGPGMWVFISLAAIGVAIAFYRRFARR